MTRIAGIIFDLDGTLVDSAPLCAEILNEMLAERGREPRLRAADARAYLTRGGHQIVAALLGDACSDIDRDLADFRSRYAARPTPEACLFPGVRDVLAELHALGIRMALCSNKPQPLCDKTVAELGLDRWIDTIVGSRPGLSLKPATDLAELTLSRLGAEAGECLWVGDSEVDLLTAEAVGVPFLLVTYGYAEPGWSAAGHRAIDRLGDLVGLVRERRRIGVELPRVA